MSILINEGFDVFDKIGNYIDVAACKQDNFRIRLSAKAMISKKVVGKIFCPIARLVATLAITACDIYCIAQLLNQDFKEILKLAQQSFPKLENLKSQGVV